MMEDNDEYYLLVNTHNKLHGFEINKWSCIFKFSKSQNQKVGAYQKNNIFEITKSTSLLSIFLCIVQKCNFVRESMNNYYWSVYNSNAICAIVDIVFYFVY